MAPSPSKAKSRGQEKSTIAGEFAPKTREISDGGASNTRRTSFSIRNRADSTGSTRGAFYQDDSTPKNAQHAAPTLREIAGSELRQRRGSRKKHPKPEHKRQEENRPSMVGLASFVMQAPDPMGDGSAQFSAMGPRENLMTLASPRTTAARRALLADTDGLKPTGMDQYSDRRGSAIFLSEHVGLNGNNPDYGAAGSLIDFQVNPDVGSTRNPSLFGAAFLGSAQETRLRDLVPAAHHGAPLRQDEINLFASMVLAGKNRTDDNSYKNGAALDGSIRQERGEESHPSSDDDSDATPFTKDSDGRESSDAALGTANNFVPRFLAVLDPTDWLTKAAVYDEDTGERYFQDKASYTLAGLVRHFLYNPLCPEFTSIQQFDWAVVIGIVMGLYTALWKWFIDFGIEVIWNTIPEKLVAWGVFTDLSGSFPLYHYTWMVPAFFGGLLSYVFLVLPTKIPGQNEWINSLHSRGIQDHRTFFHLFFLSTAGMWSGLSLGPELPLILTGGMAGSWLALITKQSVLQARVMNLTGAGAAVGGYFGFPMAGALYALELPHRMGLQYFEALSPGTIASIVAVLANRLVTGNDVTGYFSYPFLSFSLPSSIFVYAIVYGLYGCFVGTIYSNGVMLSKTMVHNWFHAPHLEGNDTPHRDEHEAPDRHDDDLLVPNGGEESIPLVAKDTQKKAPEITSIWKCSKSSFCLVIPNEPKRAAVAGTIAGALVGVIGIFVPHIMFWGEAQLQNLIDKGRTPLPIFGHASDLTAYARCMIDPDDKESVRAGFSIGCSVLISLTKILVTGLSAGTGIVGGHFWGPLYVGCAASNLLTDVVELVNSRFGFGFGHGLAAYPCVVILCTMGAAHVVTFRAHMAIMLILTLTISAFNPEAEDSNSSFKVAGDYSAVFPLLVVSVFLSLMTSRNTVFYASQRSRGDITAVPAALCRPGMEGTPMVVGYDPHTDEFSYDDSFADSDGQESDIELAAPASSRQEHGSCSIESPISQRDIEKAFAAATSRATGEDIKPMAQDDSRVPMTRADDIFAAAIRSDRDIGLSSSRLDELLGISTGETRDANQPAPTHRRAQSAPFSAPMAPSRSRSNSKDVGSRSNSGGSKKRGQLVRVMSYGHVQDHQPSLMDQALMQSASAVAEARHRRVPSLPNATPAAPKGRRNNVASLASSGISPSRAHLRIPSFGWHSKKSSDGGPPTLNTEAQLDCEHGGALSVDDIEQAFSAVVNEKVMGSDPFFTSNASPWTNN